MIPGAAATAPRDHLREWHTVYETRGALVTLAAHEFRFNAGSDITVPWKPSALGDHVADANWIDHLGPAVDVHDVMESVPDHNRPEDGRPYALRGGAFSTGIDFKVDRAR